MSQFTESNLSPKVREKVVEVANKWRMTPDEVVQDFEKQIDNMFSKLDENSIPDRSNTKDLTVKILQHFNEKPSVYDYLEWLFQTNDKPEKMDAGLYEPFACEDGGRPFKRENLKFITALPETNHPFFVYHDNLAITYSRDKAPDGNDWRICEVSVIGGNEDPSQNEINGILECFSFDLNQLIRVIRVSDYRYSLLNDMVYYNQQVTSDTTAQDSNLM